MDFSVTTTLTITDIKKEITGIKESQVVIQNFLTGLKLQTIEREKVDMASLEAFNKEIEKKLESIGRTYLRLLGLRNMYDNIHLSRDILGFVPPDTLKQKSLEESHIRLLRAQSTQLRICRNKIHEIKDIMKGK